MRDNIKTWCSCCARCMAYNAWQIRQSEVYFAWPITVPFWIVHLDIWSSGLNINNKRRTGIPFNGMCDFTQFVTSTVIFDTTVTALAELFMTNIILTFGMCSVVVVDDGSSFKGNFIDMCK